jgi:Family of unknown function (DUF6629)
MCFSAEATVASGGVLIALGGYCLRAAAHKAPRYWAFAVTPVGFGIQQLAEGAVWLGLHQEDAHLIRGASAVYLFFGLALWPCWFPLAAAVAEPRRVRARVLFAWAGLATGWFWFTYLPVFAEPGRLAADVAHHSLHYGYSDSVVFADAHRWPVTALYILCTAGPLLVMSRWREMLVPVVVGPVAVLVSAAVYAHAYTSVWCFFAALLSAYSAYHFATIPAGK